MREGDEEGVSFLEKIEEVLPPQYVVENCKLETSKAIEMVLFNVLKKRINRCRELGLENKNITEGTSLKDRMIGMIRKSNVNVQQDKIIFLGGRFKMSMEVVKKTNEVLGLKIDNIEKKMLGDAGVPENISNEDGMKILNSRTKDGVNNIGIILNNLILDLGATYNELRELLKLTTEDKTLRALKMQGEEGDQFELKIKNGFLFVIQKGGKLVRKMDIKTIEEWGDLLRELSEEKTNRKDTVEVLVLGLAKEIKKLLIELKKLHKSKLNLLKHYQEKIEKGPQLTDNMLTFFTKKKMEVVGGGCLNLKKNTGSANGWRSKELVELRNNLKIVKTDFEKNIEESKKFFDELKKRIDECGKLGIENKKITESTVLTGRVLKMIKDSSVEYQYNAIVFPKQLKISRENISQINKDLYSIINNSKGKLEIALNSQRIKKITEDGKFFIIKKYFTLEKLANELGLFTAKELSHFMKGGTMEERGKLIVYNTTNPETRLRRLSPEDIDLLEERMWDLFVRYREYPLLKETFNSIPENHLNKFIIEQIGLFEDTGAVGRYLTQFVDKCSGEFDRFLFYIKLKRESSQTIHEFAERLSDKFPQKQEDRVM